MESEGGRAAPGELALLQAFVNTKDTEPRREDLHSPEALRAWLAAHGLPVGDAPLNDADLRRALEVREGLRALLDANNGAPLDDGAVALLNAVANDACLTACFDHAGRAHLQPSVTGIHAALGRLLAISYTAMADGTWTRLKACRDDECRWAFYDYSKNHSGAWCSMASCGSRNKARAYRQRHREAAAPR